MAFERAIAAAHRILEGIEGGSMSSADSLELVEKADPALIYLLFTWLRHHYGPSHPASDAVLGRMVAISNKPTVAAKMKEGRADPVVAWFEDAYSYRELDAKAFVELI